MPDLHRRGWKRSVVCLVDVTSQSMAASGRLYIRIGHDGRDEFADLLNLVLAAVRDQSARDGLGATNGVKLY